MENRPIHFIPLEITTLILARVPARSLLRFRCVCKCWCNLIDSLWFARNQVSIASLQPQIMLVPVVPRQTSFGSWFSEESSRSPILFLSYEHTDCNFVGEVGFGLVCFQSKDRLGEAYLCNPLRRQVLVLPTVTVMDSYAFRIRNRYGMGFDSATNAYKIVHVLSVDNSDRFVAEVYTFGTKSLWRRISSSVLRHSLHSNSIYAHGDMHWTNYLPYRSFFQYGPITSFNFEKEEFKLTPLPDFGYKPAVHEKFLLTTLRGSLAVVHIVPEETHVEIWVMKDYENKVWVREYKISIGNRPKWDSGQFVFSDQFFIDVREHEHHLVLLRLINIIFERRLINITHHTDSVISIKHFGNLVADFHYYNFFLRTPCFFYVSPYMKMEQLQHFI